MRVHARGQLAIPRAGCSDPGRPPAERAAHRTPSGGVSDTSVPSAPPTHADTETTSLCVQCARILTPGRPELEVPRISGLRLRSHVLAITRRRRWTAALIVWAAIAPVTASAATRQLAYRPLDPDGTLRDGLSVDRRVTPGACDRASKVVTHAFECLESGAFIREPCYRDERRQSLSLLCVSDPWAHAAIGFDVPALPSPRPPVRRPWALELASGLRCVAIELGRADVTVVAGRRLSFECTPLLGGIDRGQGSGRSSGNPIAGPPPGGSTPPMTTAAAGCGPSPCGSRGAEPILALVRSRLPASGGEPAPLAPGQTLIESGASSPRARRSSPRQSPAVGTDWAASAVQPLRGRAVLRCQRAWEPITSPRRRTLLALRRPRSTRVGQTVTRPSRLLKPPRVD